MVSGSERLASSAGLVRASVEGEEHIIHTLSANVLPHLPVKAWLPSRGVPTSMACSNEGLLNMRPI